MKIPCPKCRKEGRDSSGDNLQVYSDGHGYCHNPACKSWYSADSVTKIMAGGKPVMHGKTPKRTPFATYEVSTLTPDKIATYPLGQDPARKLLSYTGSEFQVRVAHNAETGEIDRVFYPYVHKEQLSYKVRKISDKSFYWVGPNKGDGLFGKGHCTGRPNLFVTEGEEDAMAISCIVHPNKVDVVSLPNGAALDDAVTHELDFFSQYNKVYLCLDSDKPGKAAATEIADWLAPITDVYIVDHGGIYKDASDYWVAGEAESWINVVKHAPIYEPEGIVNGIDIDLNELLKPLPEGYLVPFSGLQHKVHGLRKAEITTVCAGSGIGKTTFVREITKSLIDQNLSVANVALEDQMDVTAQALVALDMNIPLSTFRFHPPPEEEVRPSYEKYIANGKTWFWKHFAGINADSLINKLYYYARSKTCDFIVLDHLSLVISSTESQNERKDIDTLMTKLAKLVVETGVGLIQIVHLRRTSGDKSYAKGGEVELTDLRGSAALEQLSWNVWALERDQQGDDRDFSRVRVLKNRLFGFTGLADEIKYYPETGRMLSIDKSDEPDLDTGEPHDPASTTIEDTLKGETDGILCS